jgi:hypothetical protein
MPKAFAFAESSEPPNPVVNTMGSSGRSFKSSHANSTPVKSGIVKSVTTNWYWFGSAR